MSLRKTIVSADVSPRHVAGRLRLRGWPWAGGCLRVLSLERLLATRVIFRDQKHRNRMKDNKVIAKNKNKNVFFFVFQPLTFLFFPHNFRTLWCFQSIFAGPVAVHAGNLLQQRKLKSVKKQKSYKQKNKKKQSFLSFFLFFRFVFC